MTATWKARFAAWILCSFAGTLAFSAATEAAIIGQGILDDEIPSLIYYEETGRLEFEIGRYLPGWSGDPQSQDKGGFYVWGLQSAGGLLAKTPEMLAVIDGPPEPFFYRSAPDEFSLLDLSFTGYFDLDLGAVLPSGLTRQQLEADLTFDGVLNPAGKPDPPADLVYIAATTVPEPSTLALLAVGVLGLLWTYRRRI